MDARKFACIAVVLLALFLNGCGNSYSSMQPPAPGAQSAAVTVTIRDTPPAGVTVLSLELTVNGAVLNPGSYQLVSTPVKIEVKQLETDAAFLSTVSIPPGTYQNITIFQDRSSTVPISVAGGASVQVAGGVYAPRAPLNAAGTASLTTSALSVGTHSITATYSGDAIFAASSGNLAGGETVNLLNNATSTVVSTSANPSRSHAGQESSVSAVRAWVYSWCRTSIFAKR